MKQWFRVMLVFSMILSLIFPAFGTPLNASVGTQIANAAVSNTSVIYYKKGFTTPFIHYRPANGTWTTVPGVKMADAEVAGYAKITISIGAATQLEACFNSGGTNPTWDSKSGKNYFFPTGTSTFVNGVITVGAPPGAYTPTPVPTATPVVTATPTATVTITSVPTNTPIPTVTPVPTDTPVPTATPVPTDTPAPTATPTIAPTATPAPTQVPGNSVTVYYKSGFTQPYLFYRQANKLWVGSPGLKMTAAEIPGYFKATIDIGALTQLEACFNDGGSVWDSRNSLNYFFPVGVSTFNAGVISSGAPVIPTPTPFIPSQNFTINFKSSWTTTYMHYRPEGGSWTVAPGALMSTSDLSGYMKLVLNLNANKIAEAAFTNGAGSWDNNGGKNYTFNPGVSTVTNGVITTTVPTGTPVPSPTVAPTNTPIPTDTPIPSITPVPTATIVPTATALPTATPVVTATPVPTATPVVTATPVPTATPSTNTFEIYYHNTFGDAYLHYRPEGGIWTVVPGVALVNSDVPGYQKITITNAAARIEAAFNNNKGTWDSNNSKNYLFTSGITTVANNQVYKTKPVLRSISVDQQTVTVALNGNSNLNVTANYADGTISNATAFATYTTVNPGVVAVSTTGALTPVALGNTNVIVQLQDQIFSVTVSVLAKVATQATDRSVTSLYMSNWNDTLNIWMNSKISQLDQGGFSGGYGPRISEVHFRDDMATNQIKEYTGYFRDETNNVKYNNVSTFNADAYFDENGILKTQYKKYGTTALPISITKDFATVPNKNVTVATYTFKNNTNAPLEYNLLEALHLNNKTSGNSNKMHYGWYDSTRKTLFVDMTGAGQFVLALTAFEDPNSYTVGDDSITNTADVNASPWWSFNNNGVLKNNASKWAMDMDVGFQSRFVIPANGTVTRSFGLTVNATKVYATAAVDEMLAKTPTDWFSYTSAIYNSWLTGPGKKQVNFDDEGMNLAYKRNLIAIKNSINPITGAMPATTNPYNYSYKVWGRDSAVTAIILDKAGFREEARKYWYWLRDRVRADGTIGTCFNLFTSNWVQFVEPEHDAIGLWIAGVYNHYKLSGYDKTFLNDMWPKLKKSADFISGSTNAWGYGAADSSIWEENIEYNVFTQATYIAGMNAAEYIARDLGLAGTADWWNGVASGIRTSIQRNDSDNKGMWNANGGYYNRAIFTDGSLNSKIDSSSDLLMVLGVIDSNSSRAVSHVNKVKANLLHDGYGIARYDGDIFYYTSPWSPAGNEALSDEPSWPQMSMYVALHHINRGEKDEALKYLKWVVARTAVGYMAAGEAVSRVDMRPLISTAVEPVTAAWYVLTALAYTDQADLKVIPYQYNVGFNKGVTVTGALTQFSNIPYVLDDLGDTPNADMDIAKVYVSNDAQNLYVRVKTKSPNTSGANVGLQIYAEDFKQSAAAKSATSVSGIALDHSAQYLLEVKNDGNLANKFVVTGGNWTFERNVQNSSTLRYDATTGEYIASFPLWSFSSTGALATNDWSNMNITLEHQVGTSWVQDDTLGVHYRNTTTEAPIYSNIE